MILRLLMLTGWLALLAASTPLAAQMRWLSRETVDSLAAGEGLNYGREPLGGEEILPDAEPVTYGSGERGDPPGQWAANISWLMYAILAILLLLVGWAVLKQFAGSAGRKVSMAGAGAPIGEEDLRSTDFRQLIREAEAAQDWRMALRYHHLLVLRTLQDRGQIRWHPYKTDSDYLAELKDFSLREPFSRLSRVFAYFWYGEHTLTTDQYQRLLSLIRPFDK